MMIKIKREELISYSSLFFLFHSRTDCLSVTFGHPLDPGIGNKEKEK